MFSGIIKAIGRIEAVVPQGTNRRLTISSSLAGELSIDQSIAHDGVCLTVVDVDARRNCHDVIVVHETLSKTRLGHLRTGESVNLERSITAQSFLDGHIVQGHVDTVLECLAIADLNGSWGMRFALPDEWAGLVIPRGAVCLNGVSLTVARVLPRAFEVAIIPYTYAHTNFKDLNAGNFVNAEFDMIGKYIVRQMALRASHP